MPHRLALLRSTLHSHYEQKRDRYAVKHPAPVDADLKRIFHGPEGSGRGETAHAFLRRHRKEIRELVARMTGDHQFAVDQVLKQIMSRCRQLRLRVPYAGYEPWDAEDLPGQEVLREPSPDGGSGSD